MGLCSSRSTVTLDPGAQTLILDPAGGSSPGVGGAVLDDEGILMVQPVKKTEGTKNHGTVGQTAKGYLEVGGDGEPTPREDEDEDEEDEEDEVEELINLSDSEGSMRSEFLQ